MHDQDTKNQTKVQKETNFRMMHTSPWIYITINTQTGTDKEQGHSPGQTTRPKQKTKITTVTTQRDTRRPHTDPTSFFFLLFEFKIKSHTKNQTKKKALWAQRRNCHLVDSRYSVVIQWNPYYTVYPMVQSQPNMRTSTVNLIHRHNTRTPQNIERNVDVGSFRIT